MPRLIDADKARETATIDLVVHHLDRQPTIDAVPVVRCYECKHRDGEAGQPNILCYQMHDNDFCSYGERKGGENHD